MDMDLSSSPVASWSGENSEEDVADMTSAADVAMANGCDPEVKVKKKCGRPRNPIPRHKRQSHKNAESRRRGRIQDGFASLKAMVPKLAGSGGRDSKADILNHAIEYCGDLGRMRTKLDAETEKFKRTKDELLSSIRQLQGSFKGVDVCPRPAPPLPRGSSAQPVPGNVCSALYSTMMRYLSDSYLNVVDGSTQETFHTSLAAWSGQALSQDSLIPAATGTMKSLGVPPVSTKKKKKKKADVSASETSLQQQPPSTPAATCVGDEAGPAGGRCGRKAKSRKPRSRKTAVTKRRTAADTAASASSATAAAAAAASATAAVSTPALLPSQPASSLGGQPHEDLGYVFQGIFDPNAASTLFASQLEDLPTIGEGLPTISEELSTIEEVLPIIGEGLPTVGENLPNFLYLTDSGVVLPPPVASSPTGTENSTDQGYGSYSNNSSPLHSEFFGQVVPPTSADDLTLCDSTFYPFDPVQCLLSPSAAHSYCSNNTSPPPLPQTEWQPQVQQNHAILSGNGGVLNDFNSSIDSMLPQSILDMNFPFDDLITSVDFNADYFLNLPPMT